MLWLISVAFAQEGTIEQAYQREYAHLYAEKKALTERLARSEQQGKKLLAAAEARLHQKERLLLEANAAETEAADQHGALEQQADDAVGATDQLDALLFQSATSLRVEKPQPNEPTGAVTGLASMFDLAAKRVGDGGDIAVTASTFFLPDGREVSGETITLGGIAAYGVSAEGAGLLMPAGGGQMTLREGEGAAMARALAAGDVPQPLDVFLFDDPNLRVDERATQSLSQFIDSGGVVGWIIVGLGGVAGVLVLLRVALLVKAGRGRAAARRFVETGGQAAELEGISGAVFNAMLQHPDPTPEALEGVATAAMMRHGATLHRFSTAILVVAAISPLLGLLGTVTGMIATFQIITEFGTGDPKLLSGGISEALVTTQLGLVVAIPTLMAGNLLKGWGATLWSELEEQCVRLITLLTTPVLTTPERTPPERTNPVLTTPEQRAESRAS